MNHNIDTSWLPSEIQILDGFNDAILGITPTDNLVYSFEKCIDIVETREEISFVDAVEYVEEKLLTLKEKEKRNPIFVKDIF